MEITQFICGDLAEYDPSADLWTRQGWIANPRAFFSSVALGDAVYLLGGSFSTSSHSAEPLDLVERVYMRD